MASVTKVENMYCTFVHVIKGARVPQHPASVCGRSEVRLSIFFYQPFIIRVKKRSQDLKPGDSGTGNSDSQPSSYRIASPKCDITTANHINAFWSRMMLRVDGTRLAWIRVRTGHAGRRIGVRVYIYKDGHAFGVVGNRVSSDSPGIHLRDQHKLL